MKRPWALRAALLLLPLALPGLAAADTGPLLARIRAVGKEGAGNVAAAKAWKELTAKGPVVLLDVLTALDDAGPVAANYLRAAVEAIADRALAEGKPLPKAKLEAFVRDTRHAGAARRLAYDYLVRIDPKAPDRLLPGMRDDPAAELRRDAVEYFLTFIRRLERRGEAIQRPSPELRKVVKEHYQTALEYARDRDQVQSIARELKKLGVEVDLTKQFGYLTRWHVVGPFDNSSGAGFHKSFPPEKGFNPKAVYQGKGGKEVRWAVHATDRPLGEVDFNKVFGELKGATAYALAAVSSPAARPVEIRATSNNAVRIYLNGKEVFAREEYHHGTRMDQHVGRGALKAGRNEILVKVCQNEQTEDWARLWHFQLRVCDALGGAVPLTVVTDNPGPGEGKQP
jgi:hypothetical protein